jgi:amino acid adenylation domain-containing protein
MNSLLHDYLIDSAEKCPDVTAVIYKEEKISYGYLHSLSSQLSALLAQKGAGTGDRIGIYIDKSIESVTAIFGILRSGACYVPLDPLAPSERQILIINDCSIKYLVTSSRKISKLRKILEKTRTLKHVFILDIQRDKFKDELSGVDLSFADDILRTENNDAIHSGQNTTKDNLAYILYTSGSTGQPKGVMLSHKAAGAFVDWSLKTFNIQNGDIVSSHAPFHFDLSVFDIFVTIKAGATICLVPQGLSSFPRSVVDFIDKNKINTWYSVPSILTQLVLHGGLEGRKLPSLKQVLFAGEVFPSKYLRRLMELMPRVEFYNLYGPTETNVITYYHVKEPPKTDRNIPIGVLCDDVTGYIVGESGSLVQEGEKGELYVTCPTLMRGYWNDEKKTQGILMRNRFDRTPEDFLYKTGDLVSWNMNGFLDYHGRCDAMIKSRGYRIELGEIEVVLSGYSGIKEAAVTAIPDDEIGSRIKAVIAPKDGQDVTKNDIRLFCSKKLPHYMIPEVITIIDALPRTSTGKIDRKKLKDESI